MNVINFEFRNEVLKHNASLSYCYQCSTCSGGCPIALITNGEYNPRKIIEEAILGLEEKLVENETLAKQAKSNTKENFKYGFEDVFLTTLISQMEDNKELFGKMMDDEDFSKVVKTFMLDRVYERLRKVG